MRETRVGRLAQQLQQEIALIIHRELKDPRVGFVTITKVELSKDLSQARVSFSCLGGEAQRQRSQEALDHSVGFIHSVVKKRFRLRVIPTITFRYDASIQDSIAMADVLDHLKETSP